MGKKKDEDGIAIENLPGIGSRRAKLLKDAGYPTVESLTHATVDDLVKINGIGRKIAEWIVSAVRETEGEEIESEVLDKDTKVVDRKEEYSRQLLEWSTQGYDVSPLEKLIKEGSSDMEKMFTAYKKSIEHIEEIKKELAQLNVSGLDEYVDRIMKMIERPSRIKQIEREFSLIKKAAKVRDIDYELRKLAIPGLKEKVEEVRAKLRDPATLKDDNLLKEIEIDLTDLRREYKEQYFISELTEEIEPVPPMEKKSIKELQKENTASKMWVDDLFLLYKNDLKLVSHHTTRLLTKQERKMLLAQLQTIRSFVKMGKSYKSGMLNIIRYDGKFILILEGKYVLLAMTAHGKVEKWAGKLMDKVISLIEKEDEATLKSWDGDVNKIKSQNKNMKALLYVSSKLANPESGGKK